MAEREPKTVRATPAQTKTLMCILPAGTSLLTGDWYEVTLAHPIIIEVPEESLASVD